MLAASTSVEGSAAYVAIERVTGTLAGRSGTFMLQHSATMTRGTPHLLVTVVLTPVFNALGSAQTDATVAADYRT